MRHRWWEWLELTATERKVLLFLLGTFGAGLAVRLYQEAFPASPSFDYRSSDSTFAALSSALAEEEEHEAPRKGPLNVNTATKQQLMSLPGIGEVTAERIILYREDVGPFTSVDDLRKVKGITRKKIERLKLLITVQ